MSDTRPTTRVPFEAARAHLIATHAAFLANPLKATSKTMRAAHAKTAAFAATIAPDQGGLAPAENAADLLRVAGAMAMDTLKAHRIPAPVEPAPEAETFTLLDRPGLVFRTVRRYMAAERIPSVEGVTLDGTQRTAARVVDVVFRSGPDAGFDATDVSEFETMARAAGWVPAIERPEQYDSDVTAWVRPNVPSRGEYPAGGFFEALDARDACESDGLGPFRDISLIDAPANNPVADHARKVVRKHPRKPAMVPQKVQQQQGRDVRRGMARCDGPGLWQIGIYQAERHRTGMWHLRATGPGTIGDGSIRICASLAGAYLAATGEEMPGQEGKCVRMVPQPCQQQQAKARPPHDQAMAAEGLTSYRCKSRFGWIMIGATDNDDAWRQALRSSRSARLEDLEKWNGTAYAPVMVPQPVQQQQAKGPNTKAGGPTSYRMPCNEPDWSQFVPEGNWTRVPDTMFPHSYRYRNDDSGETVLVPAMWYTGLASERAAYLRYCADNQDAQAKRHDNEGKPWSTYEAKAARKRADNLRDEADIYANAGKTIAGHVTLRLQIT